ncbi:hypothetical protein [Streptomyces sp. NPDC051109]|uniref:hypothetical protein n=1 Tax=Streptomyces sp. NPDC051109 TaxID=3365642 RepID=UPI00378910A8
MANDVEPASLPHWTFVSLRRCRRLLVLLAVTPGTLVMFSSSGCGPNPRGKTGTCTAPSTIDRRISGTVVSARAEHGVRMEDGVGRLARNRLEQLVKEMEEQGETRGRGQAPPLLVEHLVKISAACPDNLSTAIAADGTHHTGAPNYPTSTAQPAPREPSNGTTPTARTSSPRSRSSPPPSTPTGRPCSTASTSP